MTKSVGRILDDLRDGIVYEVFDHVRHRVRGYLLWAVPDCLASLDSSLLYTTRTRSGLVYRDIRPLAVESVIPGRRKAVLSGA